MKAGERRNYFGLYPTERVAENWGSQPSVDTFADTETAEAEKPSLDKYKDFTKGGLIGILEAECASRDSPAERSRAHGEELRALKTVLKKQLDIVDAKTAQNNALKQEVINLEAQLNALQAELRRASQPREANVTLNFTVEVNPGIDIRQISQDLAKYGRLVARYG